MGVEGSFDGFYIGRRTDVLKRRSAATETGEETVDSVITIQAQSSGHHRFGEVFIPPGSKLQAASSGPRRRK